jgi:hypothetical protein
MSTDDLAGRVASLTEREQEQLLQAVTDRLLEGVDEMVATDEDSARELLADLVSEPERPVNAEEVIRPSVELESYVASTLALLASDPDVGPLVRLELDRLQPESQMFVDPITAAVVLGALVIFLQTKFDAKISRKDGRTEFHLAVKREAASDELVGKVIDAVRGVVVR